MLSMPSWMALRKLGSVSFFKHSYKELRSLMALSIVILSPSYPGLQRLGDTVYGVLV